MRTLMPAISEALTVRMSASRSMAVPMPRPEYLVSTARRPKSMAGIGSGMLRLTEELAYSLAMLPTANA